MLHCNLQVHEYYYYKILQLDFAGGDGRAG